MNLKVLTALCALVLVSAVDGYHILCIFTVPSKSHTHLGMGIVNSLLKAGHEVTFVTPYPPKAQKGLRIIDASHVKALIEAVDVSDPKGHGGLSFIRHFSANISSMTAETPALKAAVVKGGFDAVVTEMFFTEVECGYAAILQVPWIILSGTVYQPNTETLVDEVRSVPLIPLMFNHCGVPMSFFEKVRNVAMYNAMSLVMWWYKSETLEQYDKIFAPLARARNVPLPPLDVALGNVSILFTNSHTSFAAAQSMPPNAIEIGGYHIDEGVPVLPKDLQDLLDASPQGVVYFSLGSVIKSSKLPADTKRAVLATLGALPYTVLWKFEEELKDLPKNVHIRAWMPQAAILAHKNTKVFITHGGMLSNLEALHYGVPLISIPVFGDQPANVERAVRAGYAVRVAYDIHNLAEGLKVGLKEMLGTDKYYKRAKYLSSLFNNRPVPPRKLVSHYIELAIESKGAFHLRSKAKEYEWYQRWMLDILAAALLVLYVLYRILKLIYKAIANIFSGGSTSGSTNKQNKVKIN